MVLLVNNMTFQHNNKKTARACCWDDYINHKKLSPDLEYCVFVSC